MKLARPPFVMYALALLSGVMLIVLATRTTVAQEAARLPTAVLLPAPTLRLTGSVDANSPAVWDLVEGRPLLHVLTSTAGQPSLASGSWLARLGQAVPVTLLPHPGNGVWMEAVIADEGTPGTGTTTTRFPPCSVGAPTARCRASGQPAHATAVRVGKTSASFSRHLAGGMTARQRICILLAAWET